MGIAVCGLVIALVCKNEILSLILLLCATVWGIVKLADEMSRGGYK